MGVGRGLLASLLVLTGAVLTRAEDGGGPLRLLARILDECSGPDAAHCLQGKAALALERAARSRVIHLSESASLVSNGAEEAARSIEPSQAASPHDLLWDRLARFINTRTLRIDFPKVTPEELRSGAEEGRGKMKKMMSMMVLAGAMKMAALVPSILGGLFLLAGKAFVVSKIALVLTLIVLIKKVLSAKGDQAVYTGASHYGAGSGPGWDRRSIRAAHHLAYSAHKP